jgi:phosphoribosylformylglycinamidine cyclo-ligase
LARKLFFEVGGYKIDSEINGEILAETLLKPHRSYYKLLSVLVDQKKIKGLAHITGGGLLENIPRILPENVSVEIKRGTWYEPPVFGVMQRLGNVDDQEMFRAFNMGVGMAIICAKSERENIISHIEELGEKCSSIGRVVEGNKEISIG